jgi:hypothetical protein
MKIPTVSGTLLPHEHRLVLSRMISGYLQHCESSLQLQGFVRDTFYYKGIKYAIPYFTFMGSAKEGIDTRVVAIITGTECEDRETFSHCLELLEHLIVEPQAVAGYYLRILPIANPVRLEHGCEEQIPTPQAIHEILAHHRESCSDGTIELKGSSQETFRVFLTGSEQNLQAAQQSAQAINDSEQNLIQIEYQASDSTQEDASFRLRLEIPRTWDSQFAAFVVSRFILGFLRNNSKSPEHSLVTA